MHSDLRDELMFKTNVSDRQIQFSPESNVFPEIGFGNCNVCLREVDEMINYSGKK